MSFVLSANSLPCKIQKIYGAYFVKYRNKIGIILQFTEITVEDIRIDIHAFSAGFSYDFYSRKSVWLSLLNTAKPIFGYVLAMVVFSPVYA